MSGFGEKVGDFQSQFDTYRTHLSKNLIRKITQKECSSFFQQEGGPHKLEGFLPRKDQPNFEDYLNIRRSSHTAGILIIEPVTFNGIRHVATEDPKRIDGYRAKLTSGKLDEGSGKWEFEVVKILDVSPGFEIDAIHRQLDLALRIKYSLAERLLNGENVADLIAMYASEQPFYKGGFGLIVKDNPVREPYLRDALLSEIERVIDEGEHRGIKKVNGSTGLSSDNDKLIYEIEATSFLDSVSRIVKIRLQKIGNHCLLILTIGNANSSNCSVGASDQFELHGGRSENILKLIINKQKNPSGTFLIQENLEEEYKPRLIVW